MIQFKVTARYLQRTIEFEVQAESVGHALKVAEDKARREFTIFFSSLNFWGTDSDIKVKPIKEKQ